MAGFGATRIGRLRFLGLSVPSWFGATVLAFLLGCYGFDSAYREIGQNPSLPQSAARSLGLIVGALPTALADRDLPLGLILARIALPLLALWAILALVWLRMRNRVRLAHARSRGEHLVVSGDDRLAALAVESELAAGRLVVIWAEQPHAAWIARALDNGAAVVDAGSGHGDIGLLGLDTARTALIAGDDDAANVARAGTLVERVAQTRPPGNPLSVIVRVDDLDARRGVEESFEGTPQTATRLRFVSLPDLAARQLFIHAPLDRFTRPGRSDRLVFILGLTPSATRYLLRMLVAGHFRDGGKPRFIVVEKDAARAEQAFRAAMGGADGYAHGLLSAECVQGDFDRPDQTRALLAALVARYGDPVAIMLDCGADVATLDNAQAIDAFYRDADRAAPPIHARVEASPDVPLCAMIHPYGSLDQFADPDLLLQEKLDELARSIHEFYLEGQLINGERIGARASMREWDDLPERFREDNRLIADCYQLKLRDIGARLIAGEGPPLRFEAGELEELAQAEHDRWMAAKLATGWVHGPLRDDARRIHPDIVPYAQLTERIKDLDREQIRMITRLSSGTEQRALRVLNIALCPGAMPMPPLDRLLAHLGTAYPDRIPMLIASFGDAGGRAALTGLAHGAWRSMWVLQGHAERLAGSLPPVERAAALAALRDADGLVALTPDADVTGAVCGLAQLIVAPEALRDGETRDNRDRLVTLGPDGAIMSAPWLS